MKQWKRKREWARAYFVLFLASFIFLRLFIFVPITIQGDSMLPTLQSGDVTLVNRLAKIQRFDTIVFNDGDSQPVVKRVIGLPGDRLHYQNDQLFINERKINEFYFNTFTQEEASGLRTSDFSLQEILPEGEVPSNEYFVLGDNRRFSYDSRFYGTISSEAIIGEVQVIFYPFDRFTSDF
ncbi:signal peptidase I [Lacticigenium naphthae]|uniref:signal peptidase I n=1 Tax=Lacticigenium naphthae TaxID=515351 RepID=UPI0004880A6D|nr:signal peptidase I [Lacticigenium naphthae]